MENKQTAVTWLISELNTWQAIAGDDTNQVLDIVRKLVEKAKEMEKQQIINAHHEGFLDAYGVNEKRTAEQYYNETYGK